MSILIAVVRPDGGEHRAQPPAEAAFAEATRQGFHAFEEFNWKGGVARWYATPKNPRGSGGFARLGSQWAAYVGTTHWRGLTGRPLLEALMRSAGTPGELPLDEFAGSFSMIMSGPRGVWLFGDALGLHKLYATSDRVLFSTSFMVCRSSVARPRVDRFRAQEYVLFGANHGLQTPVSEVGIADPTLGLNLSTGHTILLHPPSRLRHSTAFGSRESAVEAVSSFLTRSTADCVNAFGTDIGMALSGGFDSRLLLASLDAQGLRPSLFVYGSPGDSDVVIASSVAASLDTSIECVDKAALDRDKPPITQAHLQANIDFFDGIAPDGAFDLGSDRSTRLDQVAGGRLNLNGGGGEILRNFFYLRNSRFSARELVAAFFSNWRTDVFVSEHERRAFVDAMADGILQSLGHPSGSTPDRELPLERRDVELVYSLFRLRYWMGRNNSIAARYGAFLTPIAHPQLIPMAASLPLAWKHHGDLEAAVIASLSPRVASGPSSYGFSFHSGPGLLHRARIAATLYRPMALRKRSAAIRRLLGRGTAAAIPDRWKALVDQLPPQDWVNAAALTDSGQINRLLTLRAVVAPP